MSGRPQQRLTLSMTAQPTLGQRESLQCPQLNMKLCSRRSGCLLQIYVSNSEVVMEGKLSCGVVLPRLTVSLVVQWVWQL
jgi:hypothetical protein